MGTVSMIRSSITVCSMAAYLFLSYKGFRHLRAYLANAWTEEERLQLDFSGGVVAWWVYAADCALAAMGIVPLWSWTPKDVVAHHWVSLVGTVGLRCIGERPADVVPEMFATALLIHYNEAGWAL